MFHLRLFMFYTFFLKETIDNIYNKKVVFSLKLVILFVKIKNSLLDFL